MLGPVLVASNVEMNSQPSVWDSRIKNIYTACSVGDLGSVPGLGRSPGEGKGYPLQYSGLENSMDCKSTDHKELDTTERLSLSLRTVDIIEEIPLKFLFGKISVAVAVSSSLLSSMLSPLILLTSVLSKPYSSLSLISLLMEAFTHGPAVSRLCIQNEPSMV